MSHRLLKISGFLMVAVALLVSSCSKVPQSFEEVTVNVNPTALEVHKGVVNATISATFPEKFVPAKAVVEITPVLVYANGETAAQSVTVQGEKVEGNNTTIGKLGGSITHKVSFDYVEGMKLSELVLKAKVIVGKKETNLPAYKIADGVVSSSTLVDEKGGFAAFGKDEFERIIKDAKSADIKYMIQQSGIRNSELRGDDVLALREYLKAAGQDENLVVNNVEISSYASPDGPTDLNTSLANRRESGAVRYIKGQVRSAKVDGSADDFFLAEATPEDWEGFKEKLKASNVEDKDLILRVLSMYDDPAVREKEIKNLAAAFEEIKTTILPELRRSKMTVHLSIIGKEDTAIARIAEATPYKLNVEEMLYAATLTEDKEQKMKIYKNASSFFPEDWRGFNNMGYLHFWNGNIKAAEMAFAKARKVAPKQPQVLNNVGVMAMYNGDYDAAEQYFGQAAGTGTMLDLNMAVVNLKKGNYDVAVSKFGKCHSNNAILARIMTKDYEGAMEKVESNKKPSGLTYYLKAVAAARMGKKDMALDALKNATEKDAKWKLYAATDLEFAAFTADEAFKNLVN